MDYAIIRLGGKQYRVREGEYLVVDRVKTEAGKTFAPDVLLGADGVTVTAKVLSHERGPKIRIGKYRKRTGYKRHNGYRSATSRVQISLGGARAAAPAKKETTPKAVAAPAAPKAEAPKAEAPKAEAPKAAAPKAANPPKGYEEMTVAEIKEGSETWRRPQLEAALAFEQKNAKRKGAIAALEAALEAKGEK
jgi:large subunit ribosomal protein L21